MDNPIDRPPIEILLIEDSPSDARLTEEALKESKVANTLKVVGSGEQGLDLLEECKRSVKPLPDIVLLDLELPGMNGLDTLAKIKGAQSYSHIPVVMLTASSDQKDILEAYQHQVNCFVTKPVDFNRFTEIIKELENFWFSVVKLPRYQG